MLQKYLIVLVVICVLRGFAENVNRPGSAGGSISGTVVDFKNAIVPGATVALQCHTPAGRSPLSPTAPALSSLAT